MIFIIFCLLAYSLYTIFISTTALQMGMGVFRFSNVVLVAFGLIFDQPGVLWFGVILFCVTSVAALHFARLEVQVNYDDN